jgi:chromosome partitioning protein
MKTTPEPGTQHKIVVLNPKGGAGKTTLATNLASYYATTGPPPTLIDYDPMGYSMRWLDRRADERPPIRGIAAFESPASVDEKPGLGIWPESRQVIVDLPAAVRHDQIHDLTYDAGSILIPVLPSAIDTYSASRFIAELLLNVQIDRRDRQLAVVANRTRQNTRSYRMLMKFLTSLRIPMITELRDSQSYVQAAAAGIGVCEMPAHRVRKDIPAIEAIVRWLDQWRMRRLDAAASTRYEHVPGAEVLTPASIIRRR